MQMPYTTPEMDEIWGDEYTVDLWMAVESEVMQAQRRAGINPHPAPGYARVDHRQWRARVDAGEHEVVAFLTEWGHPGAHLGMTSSDLVDTATAMRLKTVSEVLASAAAATSQEVTSLMQRGQTIDRVARTHGQYGPLTKWGRHWAGALTPLQRARTGLVYDLPAHLSGPVGSYSKWLPVEVAMQAAGRLGLDLLEPSGTQAVSRDVYVRWAQAVAALATGCAQLARVVREGTASDVQELRLTNGVTSSAMPHKSNPTVAERIEGIAILVNAQVAALSQVVTWWGERDLVHSSVERVAWPLISSLTHYSLQETTRLLQGVEYSTDGTGFTRSRATFDPKGPLRSHNALCEAQAQGLSYLAARVAATTKEGS